VALKGQQHPGVAMPGQGHSIGPDWTLAVQIKKDRINLAFTPETLSRCWNGAAVGAPVKCDLIRERQPS
jgi:hypothetical protein